MQFTPKETKLVKKLRVEQRLWPYLRWAMLVLGVLSIILCAVFGRLAYLLTLDSSNAPVDSSVVFMIALLWMKCCVWFFVAATNFITVSAKWHGDPNRLLLLRLLDAQHNQTVIDGRVA